MLYRLFLYIRHWLMRVDAHSLHSPLLFDFYNSVIAPPAPVALPATVEGLIREARRSDHIIERKDYGAGSKAHGLKVPLGTLAKYSTSTAQMRQLLINVVAWQKPGTALELGTSLGFSSITMATAPHAPLIYTIEGCPQTAAVAKAHMKKALAPPIHVYEGAIEDRLPEVLDTMQRVDLAYLDANHRYEPTLRYFNEILPYLHPDSAVIVGDISWSKDMARAWHALQHHERVSASIDLNEAGILFFKPLSEPLHYAMAMPKASAAQ